MNIDTIIIIGSTLLAAIVALTLWDAFDTRRRRKATIRKAHAAVRENIQAALDGDAKATAQVMGASDVLRRLTQR